MSRGQKKKKKKKDRALLPGATIFFSDREARARLMREMKRNPAPPGVDPVMWFMHFSGLPEGEKATCEDCLDLKAGVCNGGVDPLACFSTDAKKRRL